MTGWSREHIDRIREATDIVAVAGEHVQIKKAGRLFKGLCPFHKEKTPSFVVNPDRQIYKCFGCGEGGDVFRLLMEIEHLSFPEVVELLASRAGIELPKRWGSMGDESVYPALEWAADYFRKRLESPAGKRADAYLKARGLAPEVWSSFGVGFAPPGWSNLLDQAKGQFSIEILNRAGLISSSEKGRHYDRFRGRIMIPIRSALGKTIGFGARSLGDEEPKYLNSPETEAFSKGRVLYGLSEAKGALKETGFALVVEGYMDVITLAQAGFTNVVAASGTAFTEDQARILRRYVEKVVLVFDGDEAGRRAAWKACGVFLGEGVDTRILTLPLGEDPDSYVQEKGAEAFGEILEEAPGVVEYARRVLLDHVKREDILKAFAYLGARMEDRIRRLVMLEEAATAFRFDLDELKNEVRKLRNEVRPQASPRQEKKEAKDVPGRAYITLLLTEGSNAQAVWVPETVFRESQVRDLYGRMRELIETDRETNLKTRILSDPQYRDFAAELLADDSVALSDIEYVSARLMERDRKQKAAELWTAIRDAETRGDEAAAQELLRELNALRQ